MSIEIGSTPVVDTNTSHTPEYKEAHRRVEKGLFNEDWAEDVRDEILEHYNIPAENIAFFPKVSGKKREIRAFSVLIHIPGGEAFYCDGHTNHAILFNEIFKKFNKLGIKSTYELPDDYKKEWRLIKGFVDPYQNGFKNFPNIRQALVGRMEKKDQNGLSEEQVEILKNDPGNNEIELPNWFKSI